MPSESRSDAVVSLLTQLLAATRENASLLRRIAGIVDVSEAELDGQHGDPKVRKDPTKWSGPSFVGAAYSECSPEYLDVLASLLDWKAGKDREKAKTATGDDKAKAEKYAGYGATDAAKARGWAARLRAGWKRPQVQPTSRNPFPNDGQSWPSSGVNSAERVPFDSEDDGY